MIGACSSIDGSAGEETSFCFVAGPEVGVGVGVAFEAALVPALEVVAVSCLDEALLEDFLISFACSFSLGACAFSFALSSFPSTSASFIGVVLVLAVGVYFALPFRFVTMAGKEGFGFSFSFFLESWGGCGGFLGTSAGAVGGGLTGAAVAVETDPGGASATSYIAVLVGALPWTREVVEVDGNAGNSASRVSLGGGELERVVPVTTPAVAWNPAALVMTLGATLDRTEVGVWATDRGTATLLDTEGGGC